MRNTECGMRNFRGLGCQPRGLGCQPERYQIGNLGRWNNWHLFLLISTLLTLGVSQSNAQQLGWKLETNDQFNVTFDQHAKTTTEVSDRTTVYETSTTLTMDWTVKEIDSDQNAVIQQTITAIKLSTGDVATPATTIAFDTGSDEKPSGPSAKIFKQIQPLIGLKFMVTMSPAGKIVDVAIPDDTLAVLQKLPDSLQLQSWFSKEGITEQMSGAAIELPTESLEVGKNWETNEAVTTPLGNFARNRSYTFTGTEKVSGSEVAKIKFTTAMEEQTPDSPVDGSKLIEFSESGELHFNVEAGRVTTSQTNSKLRTESQYREKSIKTTVVNTSTMKVEKL